MKSPWISALRSAALTVPDLAAAEIFYTQIWRLSIFARDAHTLYFKGSGADAYLLALHQQEGTPQIKHVTLRARNLAAFAHIAHATVQAGGVIEQALSPAQGPAGGQSMMIKDADGRRFEIVLGDARATPPAQPSADQPVRLAHAVLNSHAIASAQKFLEQVLGFVLADRTKIMAFMNCNDDHHSLALGDTDNNALNHIAFLMPTLDAVMRGGGRMKDAGHSVEWGPGRHGPGDNTFNYFIDPFGIVIEYTAEVEQIDDNYKVGMPTDWGWPTGRVDQWGIGIAPTPKLKAAQRAVLFATSP